jgi:hypothetical protein
MTFGSGYFLAFYFLILTFNPTFAAPIKSSLLNGFGSFALSGTLSPKKLLKWQKKLPAM